MVVLGFDSSDKTVSLLSNIITNNNKSKGISMFTKTFIQVFTVITLMAISNAASTQNKVVVIPLGGDDIAQCNVSSRCDAMTTTSTLECPSGEVVIPCDPPLKAVFITSTTHQGNLGGLQGADSICNTRATEAGLEGLFKAWVSSSSVSVAMRFTQNNDAYVTVDRRLVTESINALTNAGRPSIPINITETGDVISADFSVWTNTQPNGSPIALGVQNDGFACEDWTSSEATMFSNSGLGNVGDASSLSNTWTRDSPTIECNQQARLYCFEQ